MRLIIEAPAEWTNVGNSNADERAVSLSVTSLILQTRALVPKPRDLEAWAAAGIHDSQKGDGQQFEVVTEKQDKTTLGWPVHIIETRARLGSPEIRARIDAFYSFVDVVGHLTVLGGVTDLENQRVVIEDIIRSARPDLWPDDDIVALDQLWR